jgi:DnaK suppressor protein
MTPEQKEELKETMTFQMEELRAEIASLEEGAKPVAPDNAIGRLTRMEAINARSISEATLASARARLAGLERALARIDSPDFGLCSVCEEPIPVKRLMLMPEASRCVNCAE